MKFFPRNVSGACAAALFLISMSAISAQAGEGKLRPGGPPGAPGNPSSHVGYGLLWLQVNPSDAEVSLDGNFVDTDVWLISLPPGQHDLSVRKAGFKPYHSVFGVTPGESVRVDVHLDLAAVSDIIGVSTFFGGGP